MSVIPPGRPTGVCSVCGKEWYNSHTVTCCIVHLKSKLDAAEKRAEEAEVREQNLIIDNANMSEAAASCLRRAEVLESRLHDAEAREAATLKILERIWHFATDEPTDLRAIAKEALSNLPARSAAVLAVLDAVGGLGRKYPESERRYQGIIDTEDIDELINLYQWYKEVEE